MPHRARRELDKDMDLERTREGGFMNAADLVVTMRALDGHLVSDEFRHIEKAGFRRAAEERGQGGLSRLFGGRLSSTLASSAHSIS
jgi:hypothetical protein